MKKYLLMLLAAFAVVTSSFTLVSCSEEETTVNVNYYTLEPVFSFDGFTAEQTAILKQLMVLEPVTAEISEFQAKQILETGISQMKSTCAEFYRTLESGQKITITYNLYKGRSASGKPVFSKTIVVTKDGIKEA